MFERLLDLLAQAGSRLLPFQVVPVAHAAGVLRFGRYYRTVQPGLRWKIPLVDTFTAEPTSITTLPLQPQTLTTADGVSIVVRAIVKYQLADVEKYLTQCWDQVDALADVTMGEIQKRVREAPWNDFNADSLEKAIATAVRRQVSRFGFEIHAVTFTDVGRIRSVRLITHSPLDTVVA